MMLQKRNKPTANQTCERGLWAERTAEKHLTAQGLVLICRNFHCKLGEIDLIMRDKAIITFVEVRYRGSSNFGTAIDTVTPGKQKKIIQTAHYYLQCQAITEKVSCRFDVVGIQPSAPNANQNHITWIKNAFP